MAERSGHSNSLRTCFPNRLRASTPSGLLWDDRQFLEERQENVLRVGELANALLSAIRAGGSGRKAPPTHGLEQSLRPIGLMKRCTSTSDHTFSLSIARQISSKPSFKMRTQISMLVDRVGSHGHEHQCASPNVLIISAYMDLVEGILHENQENCSE